MSTCGWVWFCEECASSVFLGVMSTSFQGVTDRRRAEWVGAPPCTVWPAVGLLGAGRGGRGSVLEARVWACSCVRALPLSPDAGLGSPWPLVCWFISGPVTGRILSWWPVGRHPCFLLAVGSPRGGVQLSGGWGITGLTAFLCIRVGTVDKTRQEIL